MNSLISIIIPTYNRAYVIKETLLSVKNQTYSNWECIVIDDHSDDETESLLKKHMDSDSRFLYVKRPSHKLKGANACRNYGKTICKGEFVLFLDSDDILLETCLEERLNVFKENKDIDFIIANTSYYKNNEYGKRPICEFPEVYESEDYLKLFLSYKIPWTIMGVLWRKKTIDNIAFDEELPRFQDLDFHVKILLNKSLKSIRIPQIDNYYRVDDNKIKSEAYISKTMNALIVFNNKQYILLNKKYSDYLKLFNSKIIFEFAIPNLNVDNQGLIKFINWATTSKLYNFNEKFFFMIYKSVIYLGLNKYKKIGMHKFNKFFKKVITQ